MRRVFTVMVVVAAAALAAGALQAHEGHAHKKFMGTVTMADESHVMIKSEDGKELTFLLAKSTKLYRGKGKVTAQTAKIEVGERVVVSVSSDKEPYTAVEVRLPAGKKK